MKTLAPEGWFYIEIVDQDEPGEAYFAYACSEACCVVDWKPGPGKLDLTIGGNNEDETEAG